MKNKKIEDKKILIAVGEKTIDENILACEVAICLLLSYMCCLLYLLYDSLK